MNKITVDLNNVESSEELQTLLKSQLDLPDSYGANWDAFWDAITGMIELPQTLIFNNWYTMEKKIPEDARILKSLLKDFNTQYPFLKCDVIYS